MRRLAGAVLVLLVAAACGDQEPGPLLALLQEETAQIEGLGLRAVQESEQDQKDGLLGKPSRARVRRTYQPEGEEPAEEAARALVERAAAEGWDMPAEPGQVLGGLVWQGAKPVDGEELSLTISVISDPDVAPRGVQPPVIILDMVHPYTTA